MFYFTSDTHFCHDKDFIWKARTFSSVWEMNRVIIENWNSIIDKDDEVYVLGDLMLKNDEEGIKCLKSLNGKIHIIQGNHDSANRIEKYKACPNVVEVCAAKFFNCNGQSFFLSHFPTISSSWEQNKQFKHKYVNLCGHTHTTDRFSDMDKGIIYHVDMDAHNCMPVSIDTILEDIYSFKENRK